MLIKRYTKKEDVATILLFPLVFIFGFLFIFVEWLGCEVCNLVEWVKWKFWGFVIWVCVGVRYR